MTKLKLALKVLIYIMGVVLAIPAVILLGICAVIIYGVLYIESNIICDIWDEKLTNEWNGMVKAFGEMMDNIKEWFIFEMELV